MWALLLNFSWCLSRVSKLCWIPLLACFFTSIGWIPDIHLRCYTDRPLCGQGTFFTFYFLRGHSDSLSRQTQKYWFTSQNFDNGHFSCHKIGHLWNFKTTSLGMTYQYTYLSFTSMAKGCWNKKRKKVLVTVTHVLNLFKGIVLYLSQVYTSNNVKL